MPARFLNSMKDIALAVGLVSSFMAFGQTYFINNYRIDQTEKTVEGLNKRVEKDHDLLIQIDANIKVLKERLIR